MSDNPWVHLPDGPPFVLPDDAEIVRKFNDSAPEDHVLLINELLPEPFVGDPAAPVLLLSNNPGIGKQAALRQTPEFMKRMRDGISLRSQPYPFIYLDPEFKGVFRWWRQKLKCLLKEFGDLVIARSVCNVVFFPYASKKFGHRRCELPSQSYGFRLIQKAIARGAVIVLMRKGKLGIWKEKVRGLSGYSNLVILRNPQMPAISPKNCDKGDYEKIVTAIEQAQKNGR
jgi:hypothetical protein